MPDQYPDNTYPTGVPYTELGGTEIFPTGVVEDHNSGGKLAIDGNDLMPVLSKLAGPATGGTVPYQVPKVAKVAIASPVADTAGGLIAWANPESASILITRVMLDVTTGSSGACTVSAGVVANGTTLGNNLITALSVAAAGLFDNVSDIGASGKSRQKMTSTQFLTLSTASGASAGLVGNLYVEYYVL